MDDPLAPVERPHHETIETRARILEAAERLFAERGFDAASVRDITGEAGCNVAAVNYHFGSKENLYLETFRRLLGELRDRRIERVRADMEANGGEPSLERLLESMAAAFLEPFIEKARAWRLMGFMEHELIDPRLPPQVFIGEFLRPLLDAAVEALRRVGPPLEPMAARLCVMSLVGQLLHVVRAHHHFAAGGGIDIVPRDLGEHVRHIVHFSAAGIRACAKETAEVGECCPGRSHEDV